MTEKKAVPRSVTYYGKRYVLHKVYPSWWEADLHATYLRAGAIFQGTFKTYIREIGGKFALYKRRLPPKERKGQ